MGKKSKSNKTLDKLAKNLRKGGKKKSATGTQVQVYKPEDSTAVIDIKAAKSVQEIQKGFNEISKSFATDNPHFNIDASAMALYRSATEALINSIGLAYQKYRVNPTQSYAYALTALITQAREMIEAIHSLKTNDQLIEYLMRNIIKPVMTDLATDMSDEFFKVKRNAIYITSPEERKELQANIDETLMVCGRKFQDAFNKLVKDISEYLKEVNQEQNAASHTHSATRRS